MRIITSAFIVVVSSLTSCNKKFKHQASNQVSLLTSCELCSYADSLAGAYRGKWTGASFSPDSATITLEHIYLSLGNPIDSSQMFFKKTTAFDNNPTQIDTVSIADHSGLFYSINYDSLWIDANNIMHQHHWFSNGWAVYSEIRFDGNKQ